MDLTEQLKQFVNNLADKVLSLEAERDVYRLELHRSSGEVVAFRIERDELKKRVEAQHETIRQMSRNTNATVDNLTAERDALKTRVDTLVVEREQLRRDKAGLRAVVDDDADVIATLTAERDQLKSEVELWLHSYAQHEPRKVTNGDGTETWHGLPVVIPVGLIPDGETPCEVRSNALEFPTRCIGRIGIVTRSNGSRSRECAGELFLMLADKPAPPITWQAPSWLRDGEYVVSDRLELRLNATESWVFDRHGVPPPKPGRYKVEDGVGTWIGDA